MHKLMDNRAFWRFDLVPRFVTLEIFLPQKPYFFPMANSPSSLCLHQKTLTPQAIRLGQALFKNHLLLQFLFLKVYVPSSTGQIVV